MKVASRIFAFILFSAPHAHAISVSLGTAISSITGGRRIPGLEATLLTESFGVSVFATGSRTPLYYHSGYTASFFYMWKAGDLAWGSVRAGIGAGVLYAQRGYRTVETASEIQQTSDLTAGPSFRVIWQALGPLYFAVEGIYGLRNPAYLTLLSAQDIARASIGVEY